MPNVSLACSVHPIVDEIESVSSSNIERRSVPAMSKRTSRRQSAYWMLSSGSRSRCRTSLYQYSAVILSLLFTVPLWCCTSFSMDLACRQRSLGVVARARRVGRDVGSGYDFDSCSTMQIFPTARCRTLHPSKFKSYKMSSIMSRGK